MFESPLYGRNTIGEVLLSLRLSLLGEANPLEISPQESVALVLIDGLGDIQLQEYAHLAPTLFAHRTKKTLTTGFPATTPVSLTSLGTGVLPGVHGVLGTGTLRDGHRFHNTRWAFAQQSYELSPEEFQPLPTQLSLAAKSQIVTTKVGAARFKSGGLSRAALRGGQYRRAETPLNAIAMTATCLKRRPSLTYTYWDGLDYAAHVFGVGSPEYIMALQEADTAVAQLEKMQPKNSYVFITGDHGHVNIDSRQIVDISAFADLKKGVRWLGGDLRARMVYAKGDAGEEVAERWTARLGQSHHIWTRAQMLEGSPYGGPLSQIALGSLPALVVADKGAGGIIEKHRKNPLVKSDHGSLTPAEHFIPAIVLKR